ncbi:MAG: hypothetical protein E4H36_03875 [Spirochaetales bacterium]|nr:MAG: hypothetical protein E4H36_03875 [Spirochaetales bacterium]
MKSTGLLCVISIMLLSGGYMHAEDSLNLTDIRVGMTSAEFSRTIENAAADGQVSKPQKLYGLSGAWTWDFREGRLDWYLWDAYVDEITENNFNLCLEAARRIIRDCTTRLGKPANEETGNLSFRDPFEDHHWGYPVLSAEWATPAVKLRAGFKFMGSKGEYHLLVSLEAHGPDYEF